MADRMAMVRDLCKDFKPLMILAAILMQKSWIFNHIDKLFFPFTLIWGDFQICSSNLECMFKTIEIILPARQTLK